VARIQSGYTIAHVETIVIEWGRAEMRGRSISERARQLIAIAERRFRDELEAEARRANFI
jgi:4-hydroxybutyrate CoA-transferase